MGHPFATYFDVHQHSHFGGVDVGDLPGRNSAAVVRPSRKKLRRARERVVQRMASEVLRICFIRMHRVIIR